MKERELYHRGFEDARGGAVVGGWNSGTGVPGMVPGVPKKHGGSVHAGIYPEQDFEAVRRPRFAFWHDFVNREFDLGFGFEQFGQVDLPVRMLHAAGRQPVVLTPCRV